MNSTISKQKILSRLPNDKAIFLEKMREMGQKRNIPNISWNTSSFFIDLLTPREIKNVLEIGPANGFSTMMLALACPEAQITSLECSRHAFEELRHNIQTFHSLQKLQTTNYKPQAQTSSLNSIFGKTAASSMITAAARAIYIPYNLCGQ